MDEQAMQQTAQVAMDTRSSVMTVLLVLTAAMWLGGLTVHLRMRVWKQYLHTSIHSLLCATFMTIAALLAIPTYLDEDGKHLWVLLKFVCFTLAGVFFCIWTYISALRAWELSQARSKVAEQVRRQNARCHVTDDEQPSTPEAEYGS